MSQEGVHHPTRADRQKCWKSRDEYFACLNKADVVDPSKPEAANVCVELRKHYHDACMKSWVEYFNKRRVLEVEQKEILERMREQHQAAAEQAKKRASTS
ncbi:hypothetical protein BGX31_003446 [Mortierella sp. GBA43]|nr:hypothetical protein BGX31_003446 [Mortierella sp. GBA43]